jgi:hypothetical protein
MLPMVKAPDFESFITPDLLRMASNSLAGLPRLLKFSGANVRLQMLWDNQRYLERRLWLVWSEIRRLSTDVAIVAV